MQLAVNTLCVLLDGERRDVEHGGDLLVRKPTTELLEHVLLTPRQRLDRRSDARGIGWITRRSVRIARREGRVQPTEVAGGAPAVVERGDHAGHRWAIVDEGANEAATPSVRQRTLQGCQAAGVIPS